MINNQLSNLDVYPWQASIWQRLTAQKTQLHHALLMHGKSGIGKLDFSKLFAQYLLCAMPVDGKPCHQCTQCTWLKEGNHPDFKLITPEDAEPADDAVPKKKSNRKSQISVDQIRELTQYLSLTNHASDALRVILIHPAEALNTASANALLKMLEEPPNNTVFILVSHQMQRLLPTILSRCQSVEMTIPARNTSLTWLKEQNVEDAENLLAYFGGAPLNALSANEEKKVNAECFKHLAEGAKIDVFLSTPQLLEHGLEHAVTMLQKWTYDLLLCQYKLQLYYHSQYTKAMQLLAKSVNLGLLLDYQKLLSQAKVTANHPLSQELQLEYLLLQYKKIFNTPI